MELLFNRQQTDSPVERLRVWSAFLREPVNSHLPVRTFRVDVGKELLGVPRASAALSVPYFRKQPDDNHALDMTRQMWTDQTLSTEDPNYRTCLQFIQNARSRGIQVILLQTPLGVTAAGIAPAEYLQKRDVIAREIFRDHPDSYIRYPRILPDRYFRDYRHLNLEGQRLFLEWLLPVLVQRVSRGN